MIHGPMVNAYKLIQYMASNKAVIADAVGASDVVENQESGFW